MDPMGIGSNNDNQQNSLVFIFARPHFPTMLKQKSVTNPLIFWKNEVSKRFVGMIFHESTHEFLGNPDASHLFVSTKKLPMLKQAKVRETGIFDHLSPQNQLFGQESWCFFNGNKTIFPDIPWINGSLVGILG